MPTMKPRVQVTLSQEAYDSLCKFAGASGRSMSSIVADMVEQNVQLFAMLGHMHETAGKMNAVASDEWAGRLEALELHAKDALGELVLDASIELDEMVASAAASGGGNAPRASNTGAKLSNQGKTVQKTTKTVH